MPSNTVIVWAIGNILREAHEIRRTIDPLGTSPEQLARIVAGEALRAEMESPFRRNSQQGVNE